MSEEKESVRRQARQFRDRLPKNPEWEDEAAQNFCDAIHLGDIKTPTFISSYFPIGSEIDPTPIHEKIWSTSDCRLCLPVIQKDQRSLVFVEWEKGEDLQKGEMGIHVPTGHDWVMPDILIVPLLAFDQRGARIGYGKGHYDETIRVLREQKPILAVGLAYAEQAVLLPLPTEDHDQRLDLVVTPQKIFDFRR